MRKHLYWLIPTLIAIAIKIFSLFHQAVEYYYSNGIYPIISRVQRALFGWIPFSIGDLLYAAVVIYLLLALFRFIKSIVRKTLTKKSLLLKVKKLVIYSLWVYIVFNLSWGLNYNRLGIGYELKLHPIAYTSEELQAVLDISVQKVNALAENALQQRQSLKKKSVLFEKAFVAYRLTKNTNASFEYKSPSLKPSLFSYLGNYLGYTGYYNPFTGEAQVNTTVPLYIQPFTSVHEIGHQLGYAKEMEANFVGYLSAKRSADPNVQYSLYFDLYVYALRNLYRTDSSLARSYSRRLHPIVTQDIRTLRAFYIKYENPFEPVIRKLYGQYLKANEQPQGILSYDEVLAWVIAYYRRYRTI